MPNSTDRYITENRRRIVQLRADLDAHTNCLAEIEVTGEELRITELPLTLSEDDRRAAGECAEELRELAVFWRCDEGEEEDLNLPKSDAFDKGAAMLEALAREPAAEAPPSEKTAGRITELEAGHAALVASIEVLGERSDSIREELRTGREESSLPWEGDVQEVEPEPTPFASMVAVRGRAGCDLLHVTLKRLESPTQVWRVDGAESLAEALRELAEQMEPTHEVSGGLSAEDAREAAEVLREGAEFARVVNQQGGGGRIAGVQDRVATHLEAIAQRGEPPPPKASLLREGVARLLAIGEWGTNQVQEVEPAIAYLDSLTQRGEAPPISKMETTAEPEGVKGCPCIVVRGSGRDAVTFVRGWIMTTAEIDALYTEDTSINALHAETKLGKDLLYSALAFEAGRRHERAWSPPIAESATTEARKPAAKVWRPVAQEPVFQHEDSPQPSADPSPPLRVTPQPTKLGPNRYHWQHPDGSTEGSLGDVCSSMMDYAPEGYQGGTAEQMWEIVGNGERGFWSDPVGDGRGNWQASRESVLRWTGDSVDLRGHMRSLEVPSWAVCASRAFFYIAPELRRIPEEHAPVASEPPAGSPGHVWRMPSEPGYRVAFAGAVSRLGQLLGYHGARVIGGKWWCLEEAVEPVAFSGVAGAEPCKECGDPGAVRFEPVTDDPGDPGDLICYSDECRAARKAARDGAVIEDPAAWSKADCEEPVPTLDEVMAAIASVEPRMPSAEVIQREIAETKAFVARVAAEFEAPCTCGSGAHPRHCKKHPEAFAEHVAECSADSAADDAEPGAVCNACDENGKAWDHDLDKLGPCEVCGGKCRWTAESIRLYHLSAPELCRRSCGEVHRDPVFELPKLMGREELDATIAECEALVARCEAEDARVELAPWKAEVQKDGPQWVAYNRDGSSLRFGSQAGDVKRLHAHIIGSAPVSHQIPGAEVSPILLPQQMPISAPYGRTIDAPWSNGAGFYVTLPTPSPWRRVPRDVIRRTRFDERAWPGTAYFVVFTYGEKAYNESDAGTALATLGYLNAIVVETEETCAECKGTATHVDYTGCPHPCVPCDGHGKATKSEWLWRPDEETPRSLEEVSLEQIADDDIVTDLQKKLAGAESRVVTLSKTADELRDDYNRQRTLKKNAREELRAFKALVHEPREGGTRAYYTEAEALDMVAKALEGASERLDTVKAIIGKLSEDPDLWHANRDSIKQLVAWGAQ